ncbi:MAG: ABC transporter permease [Bacteroidota bacterium]
MNRWLLTYRHLRANPLTLTLNLILLTMGVGIISLLLVLENNLNQKFEKNLEGISMVVGAKGSPLQLILSSVYHLDAPTGNISLAESEKIRRHPMVKAAIPLAYGDSYQGYRIVGTDESYLKKYQAELAEGKRWEETFEVTAGAQAAKQLRLKIGDTFQSAHGLDGFGETHDTDFRVVGILKSTGTVADQLLLTDISSIWEVHDHDHEGHNHDEANHEGHDHEEEEHHDDHADHNHEGHDHEEGEHHDHSHEGHEHEEEHQDYDEHDHEGHDHGEEGHDEHKEESEGDKEITALLLEFRSPLAAVTLPRFINENTDMQAALPAFEINRLMSNIGLGVKLLQGIALAVILVSGISVFISLYKSLRERRYELALMRALGGSRNFLFTLILQEGLILAFLGCLLGWGLGRLGLWTLSRWATEQYRYGIENLQVLPSEWGLFAAVLGIGFLAALLPAVQAAYRSDLSEALTEG